MMLVQCCSRSCGRARVLVSRKTDPASAVQLSINLGSQTTACRQPQAGAAYVVFHSQDDAWSCIEDLDNRTIAGKVVKACYGTTKYCHAFLKGMACNNPDCQYLHELGAVPSRQCCPRFSSLPSNLAV